MSSRMGNLLAWMLATAFIFIGNVLAFADQQDETVQVHRLHWRRNVGNGTLAVPGPPEPANMAPPGSSTCVPWEQCNLFYQYVSVFYWPQPGANTDCLNSLASPTPTTPPGIDMVFPSIYAIFPSIIASDGCNQIGNTYKDQTTSFAPGQLSTIDSTDGSTKVFNFADLPCPPPGIQVDAGQEYKPLIAPPPFIFNLDPAFSTCIPGHHQGVDPPYPVPPVSTINGGHCSHGKAACKRHLNKHIRAPMTAWTPEQTAQPVAPFRNIAGLGKG